MTVLLREATAHLRICCLVGLTMLHCKGQLLAKDAGTGSANHPTAQAAALCKLPPLVRLRAATCTNPQVLCNLRCAVVCAPCVLS